MKIIKYATIAILIVAAYFGVIKPIIINKLLLNSNNDYAVGKVVSKSIVAEGGPIFEFAFTVENVEYIGTFGATSDFKTNIGDCYRVKYYPPNPNICTIDLKHSVLCQ